MWSYITARAIKASYYGGNPCGCCVFLFVCFFDLPGPTFFLFFLFLNIHKVHVLANLRKLFGLKQKKKKKSLAILYIVKDSVYTCVALHSCA